MSDFFPVVSAGGSGVLNNYAATAAPIQTNDATQGYSVGSVWLVPGTGEMWRARSVTAGAARWVKLALSDHDGYVAGNWYLPDKLGQAVSGLVLSATSMVLLPGVVKQRITVSRLGSFVTTLSAGGNFQLAIYSQDPISRRPALLLAKTGSLSTATATNVDAALDISRTLEPGSYWFAIEADNATAVFASVGSSGLAYASTYGSATSAIKSSPTGGIAGLSLPSTFGVWPTDLSGSSFTELPTRAPLVQFLVASVP